MLVCATAREDNLVAPGIARPVHRVGDKVEPHPRGNHTGPASSPVRIDGLKWPAAHHGEQTYSPRSSPHGPCRCRHGDNGDPTCALPADTAGRRRPAPNRQRLQKPLGATVNKRHISNRSETTPAPVCPVQFRCCATPQVCDALLPHRPDVSRRTRCVEASSQSAPDTAFEPEDALPMRAPSRQPEGHEQSETMLSNHPAERPIAPGSTKSAPAINALTQTRSRNENDWNTTLLL